MSDDLAEPRVEDLAGSGWAGLDNLNKQLTSAPPESDDELTRVGGLALKAFSTDEGREVLEWMMAQTLRRSSVPDVGLESILIKPEALASYVLWNEAQKAFVLRVVGLMEAGKRSKQKRKTRR